MKLSRCRRVVVAGLLACTAAIAAPATAGAATGDPLGIACTPQPDGARFCPNTSLLEASDHQNILAANVTLPAAPSSGTDGNYPLVIVAHGWGGQKKDFASRETPYIPSAKEWAEKGYAVLNVTDRGFNGSCGSPAVRLNPANAAACQNGYIRLDDTRYEIRDVQFLAGVLADQGWIDPQKIGAMGESYGGGLSLMLGTLKNRVMNVDGTLAPWTSPHGTPMAVAATVPTIPWSSLVSSLLPNGRDLDYAITKPGALAFPAGVQKQSFVSGLYALGQSSGYYAAPGQDANADLTTWFATISAGEPYSDASGNPTPAVAPILTSFVKYRGPYYLLDGEATGQADTVAPAPMLLSNGFTDDLFPVEETLRYYNLERQLFPTDPVSLVYMDYGHQRGAGRTADTDYLRARTIAWIDHYVNGASVDPGSGVTARTQVCPTTDPSGGPFAADTWDALHPGELKFSSAPAQNIVSGGGNPGNAATFDPIAAGSNPCATVGDDSEPGSALYTLPAATGGGYTMIGFPTVKADITVTGEFPEIAERLLDVDSSGKRTLVARGVYRPDAKGTQVFQLHAGAWHFAAGHAPELELLPQDSPYVRPSNGKFTISVSNLTLRLPTRETSGNGITLAAPQQLPQGSTPAPGADTSSGGAPLGGGGAKPGSGVATVLSHLKAKPRSFRAKGGTTLSFVLSRRSSVRFTVIGPLGGGHKAARTSFVRSGRKGLNRVRVSRRHGHRFRPGHYRVTVAPLGGKARSVTFTVRR